MTTLATSWITEVNSTRATANSWRYSIRLANGFETEISGETYQLLEKMMHERVEVRVRLELEGVPIGRKEP